MNLLRTQTSLKTNSYIIATCILLSRVFGLLREIVLARYLGTSIYSDALKAALKIPNFLQNLFGEGVLSASFIPVYTKLNSQNKLEESSKTAKEIGIILLIILFVLCPISIYYAQYFVELLAPGYSGELKDLTIKLIKILFPATSLLVLSAWCLGILNSHKIFIISYSSPIVWNITIILGLLLYSNKNTIEENCFLAAYLFLLGSFFQLIIQLPKTFSLITKRRVKLNKQITPATKEIINNFFPVVFGRGIIQLSSYIDTIFASFLSPGSLSSLLYAQTIYLTPVSVFGLSNAAASLTELSEKNLETLKNEERNLIIQELRSTIERIFFFTAPTCFIFCRYGNEIIKLLFESGKFDSNSTFIVHNVLIGLTIGLIPTTWSRILTSFLYAAGKQKTVSKIAFFRLLTSVIFSYLFCFQILTELNLPENMSILGIAYASTISSFFELLFLSSCIRKISNFSPVKEIMLKNKNLFIIFICLFLSITISELSSQIFIATENSLIEKTKWMVFLSIFLLSYFSFYKISKKFYYLDKF
jgi:putative peptidoglycan lipid II flippase